jgi:hypothetical protein
VEANELIYRMSYEIEVMGNAGIVKITYYEIELRGSELTDLQAVL